MEIYDKTTCLEILKDQVEKTKLKEKERNVFYDSPKSPEGIEMIKKIRKEDNAKQSLYDYKRESEFHANDRDGYNKYKIIGVTDDGNLIINYCGSCPWM